MIIYVISAAEDFRNNNNNEIDDDLENEDALKKVFSDAARFDPESEIERQISKSIAVKDKDKNKARISRDIKFEKLLRLSNVYINLYLTENTKEYTTIMNSNVLTKELKHKLFTFFVLSRLSLIIVILECSRA